MEPFYSRYLHSMNHHFVWRNWFNPLINFHIYRCITPLYLCEMCTNLTSKSSSAVCDENSKCVINYPFYYFQGHRWLWFCLNYRYPVEKTNFKRHNFLILGKSQENIYHRHIHIKWFKDFFMPLFTRYLLRETKHFPKTQTKESYRSNSQLLK